jgi:hypothetical protein
MKNILTVLLALGLSPSIFGGVLFQENFEGGLPGSNWSFNSNGTTVLDPTGGGNLVLDFTTTQGGGDLFSTVIPSATTYYLEFDYYYDANVNSFGGGFVGVDSPGETWLLGDCAGCYATPFSELGGLPGNQWNHVQIAFTQASVGSGPMELKLEQFTGAAPNAYFDNIRLADDNFAAAAATAPEPASGLLAAFGAGMILIARRRR